MKIFKTILVAIIVIIIGILFIKLMSIDYSNKEIIEMEVKDKYVKRIKEKDTYMVVDINNNTYKITDLMFIGKFNSTDIYNSLNIGHVYLVEITGVRNRFLSWYQNINKIL